MAAGVTTSPACSPLGNGAIGMERGIATMQSVSANRAQSALIMSRRRSARSVKTSAGRANSNHGSRLLDPVQPRSPRAR
jgi:hypothetical protein